MACTGQIGLGRLARAIPAGNRGGAVGRTTDHLIDPHLPLMAVRKSDNRHPEMQKIGDDREQRRFLAAVLSGARCEGSTNLAVQCALRPQTSA